MNKLSYPIGKFHEDANAGEAGRNSFLRTLEEAPAGFRSAVAGLSDAQLDAPYRDGGWTVRQVIHHVADSHMHSYARFRFALTEPDPVIKPYNEAVWAELPDAKSAPVELSLSLLDALHARWVMLLRTFGAADWERAFLHPELGPVSLGKALQLYSWHCRHHTAHITRLRERNGW